MERDVLQVLQRTDISHVAKLVYQAVRYYDRGRGCWASRETIGEVVGLSARQVGRGLRELVDMEILSCERRGLGLTNLYKSTVRVEPEPVYPDVPERVHHEMQLEKEQEHLEPEPKHVSLFDSKVQSTYMPEPEDTEPEEHVETIPPSPIPPKPERPTQPRTLSTWIHDGEEFSWKFTPEQVEELRVVQGFYQGLFEQPVKLKECAYWMHAYPGGLHTWRLDQVCSAILAAFEAGPDNPIAYLNAGTQGKVPFLVPDPFSEEPEVYQDPRGPARRVTHPGTCPV